MEDLVKQSNGFGNPPANQPMTFGQNQNSTQPMTFGQNQSPVVNSAQAVKFSIVNRTQNSKLREDGS